MTEQMIETTSTLPELSTTTTERVLMLRSDADYLAAGGNAPAEQAARAQRLYVEADQLDSTRTRAQRRTLALLAREGNVWPQGRGRLRIHDGATADRRVLDHLAERGLCVHVVHRLGSGVLPYYAVTPAGVREAVRRGDV